jgi:multidrug efflux pump subunit AcrA (membrane-fusion protein)
MALSATTPALGVASNSRTSRPRRGSKQFPAAVYVRGTERVEAGQPLFRLVDTTQRTAVETARRGVAEVDAAAALARADLAASQAHILEA